MIERNVFLRGCLRVLLLYDIGEAIDLDKLRALWGPRADPVRQVFGRRTPDYVRFEHAPILEPAQSMTLRTGEQVFCSIKYYAFAVVVVQLEISFEGDWGLLLSQASRWIDASDIGPQAREIVTGRIREMGSALTRPTEEWLEEQYLVIDLDEARESSAPNMSAADLMVVHGEQIAQLIRGELEPLAPAMSGSLLEASLSYYPSDLVVIGSSAALVYDRGEDATATNQILEYAKMQLLEFRYYDGLMTRLLSEVYAALERKRNVLFSRWSLPRDARRFNTIRLDVMELTERIDNAIKFVSDVYYARLYRLAATRMGVSEYRALVDEKLRTVGELYDAMVDQFNEARSFVLEVGVAILALLDIILWLRAK